MKIKNSQLFVLMIVVLFVASCVNPDLDPREQPVEAQDDFPADQECVVNQEPPTGQGYIVTLKINDGPCQVKCRPLITYGNTVELNGETISVGDITTCSIQGDYCLVEEVQAENNPARFYRLSGDPCGDNKCLEYFVSENCVSATNGDTC